MRKLLYICCLLISFCKVDAQEVYEQLNLDVAVGGEGYIKDWKSGDITDVLLSPADLSFALKIRLNYYFHKHWGIHADLSNSVSRPTKNKKGVVPDPIANLYRDHYYVTDANLVTDNTYIYMRFLTGLQYRWEKQNWSIIPRLSFGLAHLQVDHCSFTLKGIGNNEQYLVEYYTKNNRDADYGLSGRIFLNPAIQFAYKLKHVHLTMELGYMQFLNKLHYEIEKNELYIDGSQEKSRISSSNPASKYNFNLGVTIPLSWKVK